MHRLEGTYKCPKHGEFYWKNFMLEPYDVLAYRVDEFIENSDRPKELPNNKYTITVICPECRERFFIEGTIK